MHEVAASHVTQGILQSRQMHTPQPRPLDLAAPATVSQQWLVF